MAVSNSILQPDHGLHVEVVSFVRCKGGLHDTQYMCGMQTQSGQTGYQSRQLCIGAWTLLSQNPDVMVVHDAFTDVRCD